MSWVWRFFLAIVELHKCPILKVIVINHSKFEGTWTEGMGRVFMQFLRNGKQRFLHHPWFLLQILKYKFVIEEWGNTESWIFSGACIPKSWCMIYCMNCVVWREIKVSEAKTLKSGHCTFECKHAILIMDNWTFQNVNWIKNIQTWPSRARQIKWISTRTSRSALAITSVLQKWSKWVGVLRVRILLRSEKQVHT